MDGYYKCKHILQFSGLDNASVGLDGPIAGLYKSFSGLYDASVKRCNGSVGLYISIVALDGPFVKLVLYNVKRSRRTVKPGF